MAKFRGFSIELLAPRSAAAQSRTGILIESGLVRFDSAEGWLIEFET